MKGLAIRASLSACCRGWCAAQQAHAADRLIEAVIVASLVYVSHQLLSGASCHPAAADARSVGQICYWTPMLNTVHLEGTQMINEKQLTLWGIAAKTVVVHTLTYFVVGLLAYSLFNYSAMLTDPTLSSFMRQTNDPIVRAGILFQPLRGVLFGLVFYLLRDVLFRQKNGWLITWIVLVVIGIFSTFAPAPSSIEGFIYTKLLSTSRWGGLIEILSQSFLLSVSIYYWVNHTGKRWLNWVMGTLFTIVLIIGALSLLASQVGR